MRSMLGCRHGPAAYTYQRALRPAAQGQPRKCHNDKQAIHVHSPTTSLWLAAHSAAWHAGQALSRAHCRPGTLCGTAPGHKRPCGCLDDSDSHAYYEHGLWNPFHDAPDDVRNKPSFQHRGPSERCGRLAAKAGNGAVVTWPLGRSNNLIATHEVVAQTCHGTLFGSSLS